ALKASKEELRRAMIRGLSQFDEVIERTKVVRVMAVGAADEIDIHALPWRGSPLFVAKPVVYGLDIGQRAYTEAPGERRALLVADPNPQDERRRLRFAQAEAERAESNLASSGWKTHRIVGRAATRSAVAAALERVELFHFAGHAWATGPVSRAALELAGGQQLQVPDVLALQRSPRVVILSACDSGRERGTVGAKRDMGVAQAFALAGAEMVVATTRLVDDRLASQVGRSLHESAAYAAMEAAQTIGRLQTKDDGDWSAFRVYVP
ncbi:MAG: CHAT domain-containing protein, partial [Myxococcota bacterium]